MKKSALVLLMMGLIVCGCMAGGDDGTWLSNVEAAKKTATRLGRPIFINFSGSDWCYWCKKLDAEVLSQDAFKEYAKGNLVLMIADFPRRKKLPAKTSRQNEELARKYDVKGFPTLLLIDAGGSVLARTRYREGGAEAYVQHLKDLLKQ